jgi:hypothetical protein
MNGTDTADPTVELIGLRKELETVRGQLARMQAERDRARLTADIARQLSDKLEPIAAFDTAAALAARVERSSTGRLVVDADGILADDVSELVTQYLAGKGAYLLQGKAARSRSDDSSSGSSKVFDQDRIADLDYARQWKETDPEGFKAAWKRHLSEIAARPVGQR